MLLALVSLTIISTKPPLCSNAATPVDRALKGRDLVDLAYMLVPFSIRAERYTAIIAIALLITVHVCAENFLAQLLTADSMVLL